MSEPTLQDLEQIARANGYWHRIAPFHEQVTAIGEVMDAKIRELTQRAEAAKAECEALRDLAKAECDSNDALRKDAARLDWLESQKVLRASFYPLCFPPCWVVEASEVTSGETLRVAIDAAMAVQP